MAEELKDKEKTKNPHEGHRSRMRSKVNKVSLKGLEPHEVLELLLTYTIPRKNTNNVAHKLLNKYGNLHGVLNADYNDLIKIDGIGDRAAVFLSMFPDLFDIYKENALTKNSFLQNTKQCVDFFRSNYAIATKEKMYIVCLNNLGKFIKTIEINGESDCSVNFNIKDLAPQFADKNVTAIVLYHTHPAGLPLPSIEDIYTTKELVQICNMLRVNFFDHIILTETDHYSFGAKGRLHDIYLECFKLFPGNKRELLKLMSKIDFLWDDYKYSLKDILQDKDLEDNPKNGKNVEKKR